MANNRNVVGVFFVEVVSKARRLEQRCGDLNAKAQRRGVFFSAPLRLCV
jgi:hypothetical protein